MRKLLNILQLILVLSGLATLFLNFSNPKVAKETMNAIKEPLQVVKAKVTNQPLEALKDKRYVKIDGQLFEYNPRHSYIVKGIPTMYANGGKSLEELGYGEQPTKAAQKVMEMTQTNPLAIYAPGNAQAIVNGAREAAEKLNDRQKALEHLNQ